MALMADYFTVGFMMNAVESSQRGGVKQSLRRLAWLLDVLIEHSDKYLPRLRKKLVWADFGRV